MDLGLSKQNAVVVGAGRGIGRAIAEAFAAEGANVALLDRDAAVADVAQSVGAASGVRTLGVAADVSNFDAMQTAAAQVENELGPVTHLVFAVGIGSGKMGFPFWNLAPQDWKRVVDVCLLGAVNTLHAFLHPMIERKQGSVLFLASVAGQIGSQTDPPYSASKAGVINFSQCAAKDLAPYNIRVNTLNPGMVMSELQRAIWAGGNAKLPEAQQVDFETWFDNKVKNVVPLGREQSPQDIANMAVFLASERARNVTGQTVNVDGGFVMHW